MFSDMEQTRTERGELQQSKLAAPPPLRMVERLATLGLCVLLIFNVMAFGAVENWSIFLFEVGAAVLGLIWLRGQLFAEPLKLAKNPLYLPAFAFFLLIVIQLAFARSAYPYATKYAVLQYVSYGIVLLIASELVRGRDSRKIFLLIMAVFGTSYALFALLQDLSSNSKLFWIRGTRFPGSIYGSYVNRDHYAGLMEMLAPIALALSMGQLLPGARRIFVGFCGVLMASTIFLCGSRGGMIAFILEMALLGALSFGRRRRVPVMVAYLALCISTLGFVFLSNNGRGLTRIGNLSPGIRPQIIEDSLRMFVKHPILGWGLATFPTVYPQYRTFYTNLFVNEAHNDYAQLLVETGIIGFAVMLWFLISLFRHSLGSLHHWQYHWDRTLSLAALVGCMGILIHSFVDFNLQITANAAFFYALAALAASDVPSLRLSRLSSDTNVAVQKRYSSAHPVLSEA